MSLLQVQDVSRHFGSLVAVDHVSLAVEPGELRAAAGGVVAFGTVRGRTRTGVDVVAPVIWVFQLRDGLVVSGRITNTAPS